MVAIMKIEISEDWLQDASRIGRAESMRYSTSSSEDEGLLIFGQDNPYLTSRMKRSFDLCVALSILLLLAPMMAAVTLLIRATSPGPAIYRQQRRGAGGKPFTIYKFRSMYTVDDGASRLVQARRDDSRTTPVGRFLRKTSIDELPQLFNVLRNEMSLIGPRPHALSHDEFYSMHIPHYKSRFAALPGLSGLAQVNGARGATPQIQDMEKRISYDLTYIHKASFSTDIKIAVATVREMFFSSSAF